MYAADRSTVGSPVRKDTVPVHEDTNWSVIEEERDSRTIVCDVQLVQGTDTARGVIGLLENQMASVGAPSWIAPLDSPAKSWRICGAGPGHPSVPSLGAEAVAAGGARSLDLAYPQLYRLLPGSCVLCGWADWCLRPCCGGGVGSLLHNFTIGVPCQAGRGDRLYVASRYV